jgi:hypothetical protein
MGIQKCSGPPPELEPADANLLRLLAVTLVEN